MIQEVGLGSSAVKRIVTALALCLAGAAVSGVLLLQHHGEPRAVRAVSGVCGGAQTSGCDEVARSSWSSFAGRPVAAWGALFYLALAAALALALLSTGELREPLAALAVVALAFGLLVDLGLLGVQAFVIRAYCTLCLLTYGLSVGALIALYPAWRALPSVASALVRPDARLAVGGWVMSALAAAGALLALDAALAGRAAARQARLLGMPIAAPAGSLQARAAEPPATPAAGVSASAAAVAPPAAGAARPVAALAPRSEASASGPQDAAFWQQRAQQLQETLDSPQKLEAYFTQKALHEYDTAPPVAIDLKDTPERGPLGAPVKVVEFSDFLCPYCRNLALALAQFVPQAGGRVVVYFKNFPLDAACNPKLKQSTHPGSCNLALGAVCAQLQGKFEPYHDKVFSSELRNPQPADVVRLAGEAGLNAQALQGCLEDPRTKESLTAQISQGNNLGVSATPTLYVNGKKLPRINDFVAVVDKEAQKRGFPPLVPK